jgi:hypothetical protein
MPDRWMHAVAMFNLQVANRPLWVLVAVYAALRGWQIIRGRGPRAASAPSPAPLRSLGLVLAIGTLASYLAIVVWYALQPFYVDYAEPTMAAIAWLAHTGQPMYPTADAAERYAHMYGPMAFLIPAWPMALLGPGIPASKIAGALAGVLTPLIVWRTARFHLDARAALIVTAIAAGLSLAFGPVAFWNRPDAFLLVLAAATLWCAVAARPILAVVGIGVALGVLVDLKLTGPLYALPALALLALRVGPLPVLGSILLGGVVAAAPFVLSDGASFAAYRHWVALSASNGLELRTLRPNLEWAAFLLAPLCAGLLVRRHDAWPLSRYAALVGGLAVGVIGVVIAAAKPGAGPYHLLPFVPAVALILAIHWDGLAEARAASHPSLGAAGVAFVSTLAVVAGGRQAYLFGEASRIDAGAVAEIAAVLAARPGQTIALGYGNEDESRTFARVVPVFAGHPYLFDMPAIQEHQMSGVELPPAAFDAMARCRITTWLIPKGGAPFTMRNGYPRTGYRFLFPAAFQEAFHRRYRKVDETPRYDVWTCYGDADADR